MASASLSLLVTTDISPPFLSLLLPLFSYITAQSCEASQAVWARTSRHGPEQGLLSRLLSRPCSLIRVFVRHSAGLEPG